jgi:hypothetical protein
MNREEYAAPLNSQPPTISHQPVLPVIATHCQPSRERKRQRHLPLKTIKSLGISAKSGSATCHKNTIKNMQMMIAFIMQKICHLFPFWGHIYVAMQNTNRINLGYVFTVFLK